MAVGRFVPPAVFRRHWSFAVLAAGSLVVLLVATRHATFFHDEWMFIDGRSFGDPGGWLRPHNEHLVALFAGVYTGLMALFGLGSYLPFLAVLFAAHIAFAAALYVLIERHVGRAPALATAAVLLLLGSGYLNLFWAFQMGFVGAAALAMWGLLFVRERPGLAALLMSLGVATSGTALFLLPAAVLYGRSRRALAAAGVAGSVYTAWYVFVGRAAMNVRGDVPTVLGGLRYIADGVAASAAALTGLGVLGVVVVGMAAVLIVARRVDPTAATVGLAAFFTEYAILAISRQGFGGPSAPHYVYLGAAFLLPVLASAWPAVPGAARPAAALIGAIALASNALELVYWSGAWANYIVVNGP